MRPRSQPIRLIPCIGIILSTACIDPFDAGENLQVTPERGKDLAETTVEITGEFAAVRYVRNLDDPNAPPSQRMSVVQLGDRSLTGVTAMGEGKLQAVVPVGMSAGPRVLRVEDAEGNALTKQAAFCVISAAEQVASIRFAPVVDAVAGEIQISLEALDDDGARVAHFAGPVELSGGDQPLTPITFSNGVYTGAVSIHAAGPRTLSARVPIDAAVRCTPRDVTSPSDSFNVRASASSQLVLSDVPTSIEAGRCSAPISVNRRDAFGNAGVDGELEVRIAVLGSAQIFRDSRCAVMTDRIPIADGASSSPFYVRSERVELVDLTAEADGLTSASASVGIYAAGPAAWVLEGAPAQVEAGQCASGATVRLVDSFGNPATLVSPVTAQLGSDGGSFFSDAACANAVTSVALSDATPVASLRFRATRAPATHAIGVTGAGLTAANASVAVVTAAPQRLQFVSAAPAATAGGCFGPVQLRMVDAFDNLSSRGPRSVAISASNNAALYADAACAQSATSLSLADGVTNSAFWFVARQSGPLTLAVQSAGLTDAQQVGTVNAAAPEALVFVTGPTTWPAGRCSPALVLETRDTFSNPSNVAFTTPLALSLTPEDSPTLYEDPACTIPAVSPAVAANDHLAVFHALGTIAGDYQLDANAAGFDAASVALTVEPGPAYFAAFAVMPTGVHTGECSSAIELVRMDEHGNQIIVGTATAAIGGETGTALTFYSDPACTLTTSEAQFVPGTSRASFHVRANRAGPHDMFAAVAGNQSDAVMVIDAGDPVSLAYVTPSQSIVTGVCSNAVVVELRDAFDNPALAGSSRTVAVGTLPTSLSVFADDECTVSASAFTILGGESSAVFFLQAEVAARYDVVSNIPGLGSATRTHDVVPGAPTSWVFTTPARSVVAGVCSAALTAQARDGYGNPSAFGGGVTLSLGAVPSIGLQLYSDSGCGTPATSLAIPAGGTEASFFARGTAAGTVAVSASSAGTPSATQNLTITPAPADRLAFTSAAPTATAGVCTGAMSVQARDPFGNRAPLAAGLPLTFEAPAGAQATFFSGASCSTPAASAAIPAGSAEATFSLRAQGTGAALITVRGGSVTPATQNATINAAAPSSLVIGSAAQNVAAGVCSAPISVGLRDTYGNAANAGSAISVGLSAAPATGFSFFSDSACGASIASVTIPAGSTSAQVYFRSTTAGSPLVSISAAGLTGAAQSQTISPAAANRVLFATTAATFNAGACSPVRSVDLVDAFGNVVPSASVRTIQLAANPATGTTFASDASCATVITEATVPAGSARATFYVRAERSGTLAITAASSGVASATQNQTVNAGGASALSLSASPAAVTAGACSSVYTIDALDTFGNLASGTAGRQVFISGAGVTGLTFYTDAGCTTVGAMRTLTTGSTTQFYLRGTTSGVATVTASSAAVTAAQTTTRIDPAAASALTFVTAGRVTAAGACSPIVTLEVRDGYGNAAPGASPRSVTVQVVGGTSSLFADASCATPLGSPSIAAGSARLDVYFRGAGAELFDLTTSSAGLGGASQQQEVTAGTPNALALISAPQTLTAGQCSGAVVVERRDGFGNPANPAQALSVTLGVPTNLSAFSNSSCATAASSVTIASGQSSAQFYVRSTVAGTHAFSVSATGTSGANQNVAVQAGAPSSLAFTSSAQSIAAGACSAAVGIALRDAYGNAATAGSATLVAFGASPAGGFGFYSSSTCATSVGSVNIAAGSSSAQVWFRGTTARDFSISATASGLSSAAQNETITAAAANRLTFVTAAQTLTAGVCSAAITVEVSDTFGNPVPGTSARTVNLAGSPPSGTSFSTGATCASAVSSVSIPAGSSSATFHVRAQVAGMLTVSVSSTGVTNANQGQAVNAAAPSALVVESGVASATAGACAGPVRFALRDAFGNEATTVSSRTVNLSAAPSTGFTFHAASGCASSVASTTLSAGSTRVDVWVRGTASASVLATASSTGLTSANHAIGIQPGAPSRVVITSPARTITAGACSAIVQLAVQDAYGNSSPVAAATSVSLSADQADLRFSASSGCSPAAGSINISAGASSGAFYFTGTVARGSTLRATASGLTPDATQGATVVAGPASVLEFTSAAKSLPINTCSSEATFATRDNYGNAANVASNLPVNLSGAPASSSFYSDASCLTSITQATVSAGTSTGRLYFVAGTAGNFQVTVAAAGYTSAVQVHAVQSPCGDGSVGVGETCDDGNTTSGDGCNSSCAMESGWICVRQPSLCYLESQSAIVNRAVCPTVGAGTIANPYCAIASGITSGRSNVVIMPGTYVENILTNSGTRTLVGEEGTVVSGTGTALQAGNGSMTAIGIHFMSTSPDKPAVEATSLGNLTIDQCTLGPTSTYGISTKSWSNIVVTRTTIRDNTSGGVSLFSGGSSYFANSILIRNGGNGGVYVRGAGSSIDLHNLTIADNPGGGVRCNGPANIRNSILWGNGGGGTGLFGTAACSTRHTNLQAAHVDPTNLSVNPLFTLDGTYHLQPTSPMVNAGSSSYTPAPPTVDFDGDPRPQGGAIDLGADEAG